MRPDPAPLSRARQAAYRKPIDQAVAETEAVGLRRRLGGWSLLVLGVANILGAGIYVMTGTAAAEFAGPAVMLSFVIAALACGFTGLCYAELSSAIPLPGAAYSYCYVTLGEGAAWALAWLVMLEYTLAAAAVSVGFAGYLVSFIGDLGIAVPALLSTPLIAASQEGGHTALRFTGSVNVVAALSALAAALTMMFGVSRSAMANTVLVLIKVGVLVVFIAVGAQFVQAQHWVPFLPPNEGGFAYGWPGVLRAAAMLFFAYLGFETVSTAAAEARNPRRDVPFGILGALVVCTVLYMAAGAVLTGLVPFRELGVPDPIALAVDRIGWPGFAGVIKLGALTGLGSVLLANAYGHSRIALAISRDGLLPSLFQRLHPRFATPWRGNLVLGGIAATCAALLPINILGDLACLGIASAFIVVCIAVMWLRSFRPDMAGAFRVPLGGVWVGRVWIGVVPVLGIVMCLGMMAPVLTDMALQVVRGDALPALILVVYCVAGAALYFGYGLRRSRRQASAGDGTDR
ncbi:amino acid permease [Pseudoxanthomonas composti]|uniref:Amino acid permease n=1 Tax=Pseudoxanthomonas composti TaxID=2137479 RepID=A0A4Q1JV33_9GAMM|nr:amino acid permease [Pseudoxanthomonas composti]RXR06000.1 amino acid permease [Pseudoxanthomonas composti]